MVRKILKYPEPLLRKKTVPVEKISQEIFTLVEDMIETMLKEDGVGLAANQIGSHYCVCVLNTNPHEEKPAPVVFINPELIDTVEQMNEEEEGCLSFPDLYLKIPRAQTVRVRARNLYNEDVLYEMSGLLARAIQHEIDHLNGVVFIDRVQNDEKDKVKKYLEQVESCTQTT